MNYFLGVAFFAVVAYLLTRNKEEPAPSAPAQPGPGAPSPAPPLGVVHAELLDLRGFPASTRARMTRSYVGEIHNMGPDPIGFPEVLVRFIDDKGRPIEGAAFSSVDPWVPSGGSTPCFFSTFQGTAAARWEADITAKAAKKPIELAVSDVKIVEPVGVAPFAVEGLITNNSSTKAKQVTAIVALYGLDGKIVGADQGLVDGAHLEPGRSARFSVKVPHVAARALTAKVIPVAAA